MQSGGRFLQWLGGLDESKTPGLSDATLYEVPASSLLGGGTVLMAALGFNISCGLIPTVTIEGVDGELIHNITFSTNGSTIILPDFPGTFHIS
jgi:hypothetical protein